VVLADFQGGVGGHLVLECVFVLAVVAEEDVLVDVQHAVLDVLLSEGGEQFSVQVIGDSTTVQHFADHVFEHEGVDLLYLVLLGGCAHQVVEVFLYEAEGGFQIGVVVLVGYTPAQ
jgi:hypothetical protein